MSGCSTSRPVEDYVIGPGYVPKNIYTQHATLPGSVRRVVLLPMTVDAQTSAFVAGEQTLAPMLLTELGKLNRFELLPVTPDQIRQWTGKLQWNTAEELPPGFFELLREKTGCDAVMFAHLSRYHPYPPLVVGWRFRLVTAPQAVTLWSADEVFDASEGEVSNGARRYAREHVKNNPVLEQSRGILLSPTRFGQYTLAAVLETIPPR